MTIETHRLIFSFSRRRGKRLHTHARQLVSELLPKLAIELPESGVVDVHGLFTDNSSPCLRGEVRRGAFSANIMPPPLPSPTSGGGNRNKQIRMEIGFGGGEHLAAQARANPDVLFIGCEPFMNGVAKLLAIIEQAGLRNIRLFTDDARLLCEKLPDGCLNHIDILFPDPWPKPRHHKRRLISHETLALLARCQPQGGTLMLATDHVDYSEWMLEHLLQSEHYEWTAECADDFRNPPKSWVETRYQRKTSAEGREPVFLLAGRK